LSKGTVTWTNAPTADTQVLASLGQVSPNTWYEVNLTSLITGDGTYSLRISDSVGGADYSSKEGSNAPKLLIALAGATPQSCAPATTATPTPAVTNTPTNTPTPGPSPTPTIAPTATATQPPPPAAFNNATFVYDGDGRRVKSTFNGTTTTYFVGNHYEVTGSTITKYYYAGSQRIAMRTNGTLNYLLGDHLGSTSLVTDSAGIKINEQRYKAWGETRYTFGNEKTRYQYTGQFSYASDFGLYFYNARWYDPALGRFAQADSIIPGGVQGYDRYAYVNNSPINYVDPSGHIGCDEDLEGHCINPYEKILDSAVVIIFGKHGVGKNTFGIAAGAQGGVGVVVGDKKTIMTATHVYELAESPTTVFVLVNGEWVEYDLADVNVETGPGDLTTVTLPSDLPGYIVPADEAADYHSKPGQTVVSIYKEEIMEGENIIGFTLHAAITVTNDPVVLSSPDYGRQLIILNPNQVMNSGDSGGGVFYNSQLIGVNSGIDETVTSVAPLCFNWYSRFLPWFASVCWAYCSVY